MNFLKHTFLFTFLILIYSNLAGQEFYYFTSSGTLIDSEENATIKYVVETKDSVYFDLFYSARQEKIWSEPEFLQVARKINDSIFHISEQKRRKEFIVRKIKNKAGDILTVCQLDNLGNTEFEAQAINFLPLVVHGKKNNFDLEGLPMAEESYLRGRRLSEVLQYNPVETGQEITKLPEFEGGEKGFKKAIAVSIRYPVSAQKNKSGGKVYVKFKIDENGKITEVLPASKPGNVLSKELIRVIKGIKSSWHPAESHGKTIAVWHYATINFNSL